MASANSNTDGIETVDDRAGLLDNGTRERRNRTVSEAAAGGPPQTTDRRKSFLHVEDDLNLTGCAGTVFCHPRAFVHRLIALSFMCLFGFGSYFCFDNPGALQREIKDTMGISTYQFANLYAWYSWPNVILPIIGGYLMDTVFGIRLGTVLFAAFILLGQVIFALGGFFVNYPLMQVGRFVFGIGGESLAVAQNTYAVSWFKGKELNMVFGFQLSVARLGSTVNFIVMGPIFEYLTGLMKDSSALGWTLMLVGGSSCLMSFICASVLGLLDKRASKLLSKEAEKSGDVIRASDVLTFPLSFWLLCSICVFYYVAVFPFISLGQVYFMKKYGMDSKGANFITGLIYLISAPSSPAFGFLIDKTGRNIFYVFLSIVMTLIGHMSLAFTSFNPYPAIIFMGLAYSLLASSLWPVAALMIPEYQLGTAYGLMQAIQNLGMALITMMSGVVVDKLGYLWLECFFILWLVLSLIATTMIWLIDFRGNKYLNMSVTQREAYDEAKRRAAEAEERRRIAQESFAERIRPRTADELRRRYLSRIGAVLPPHLGHANMPINLGNGRAPAHVVSPPDAFSPGSVVTATVRVMKTDHADPPVVTRGANASNTNAARNA